MSDYLLPNNELSIEEKIQVFSIRNKMDKNIPANFCSSQKIIICFCGNRENMEHIYKCKLLNEVEPSIKYEKIYSENIKEIKAINERFQENMNRRQQMINEIEMKKNLPHDPICDPLYSV